LLIAKLCEIVDNNLQLIYAGYGEDSKCPICPVAYELQSVVWAMENEGEEQ
jgi:hypothetical protein